MDHRSKNTLFLGIVAIIAIILGYFIVKQPLTQEPDTGIPPALKTSKERTNPQPVKSGTKTPVKK